MILNGPATLHTLQDIAAVNLVRYKGNTVSDEYEDNEFTPLVEMSDNRTASYIRGVAFDIWIGSQPHSGGNPTMTVQEAFEFAETFVVEAKRRGY